MPHRAPRSARHLARVPPCAAQARPPVQRCTPLPSDWPDVQVDEDSHASAVAVPEPAEARRARPRDCPRTRPYPRGTPGRGEGVRRRVPCLSGRRGAGVPRQAAERGPRATRRRSTLKVGVMAPLTDEAGIVLVGYVRGARRAASTARRRTGGAQPLDWGRSAATPLRALVRALALGIGAFSANVYGPKSGRLVLPSTWRCAVCRASPDEANAKRRAAGLNELVWAAKTCGPACLAAWHAREAEGRRDARTETAKRRYARRLSRLRADLDLRALAAAVRAARLAASLSQAALAAKTGMSRSAILTLELLRDRRPDRLGT
jgi:hypothetical protein